MPVIINKNINLSTKFFSNALTGKGKKSGILNESLNPANVDPKQPNNVNCGWSKSNITQDDWTIKHIPTYPVKIEPSHKSIKHFNPIEIAHSNDISIKLSVDIKGVTIKSKEKSNNKISENAVTYLIHIFVE